MTFEALREEILTVLGRGVAAPLSEASFNDLALRVFRFQCAANPAFGGFVLRRGVDPASVRSWADVPFLPTMAFKAATVATGDPTRVEAVFRTSGTTRGRGAVGVHRVRDLALYRSSLLPNFKAHLLPDLPIPVRILCLLPSPEGAPDSSLAFMMGEVVRQLGAAGSGFYWDPRGHLDVAAFSKALGEGEEAGIPVLVAGTAFALVGWAEHCRDHGFRIRLPEGSRIMETGGYKGRSRELPRADLYGALTACLGVETGFIVNEYGMTELLSQFYEPVLPMGWASDLPLSERYHRPPPWVRTLVLDPVSLRPVPRGERGILAHFDLANLGSVSPVLTEDIGRETGDGFQMMGRSPGSELRGCSLAMEDFLASARERS